MSAPVLFPRYWRLGLRRAFSGGHGSACDSPRVPVAVLDRTKLLGFALPIRAQDRERTIFCPPFFESRNKTFLVASGRRDWFQNTAFRQIPLWKPRLSVRKKGPSSPCSRRRPRRPCPRLARDPCSPVCKTTIPENAESEPHSEGKRSRTRAAFWG